MDEVIDRPLTICATWQEAIRTFTHYGKIGAMSSTQAGHLLGVSHMTVQRWWRGQHEPVRGHIRDSVTRILREDGIEIR